MQVLTPPRTKELIESHPKAVDIIAIAVATGVSIEGAILIARRVISTGSPTGSGAATHLGEMIESVLDGKDWVVVPALHKRFGADAITTFRETRRLLREV